MGRPASLLLLLALLAASATARAEPAAVAGRWASAAEGGRAELVLEPSGRGFTARLALGGRTVFDAPFAPSDRPGVYEATATGLFAMLGQRRAPANPLEGEELVWARDLPDGLMLSRLAIAAGRPVIEQARIARAGDRLTLAIERLRGEAAEREPAIELARSGR
jgi:hypothetical protein